MMPPILPPGRVGQNHTRRSHIFYMLPASMNLAALPETKLGGIMGLFFTSFALGMDHV